MAAREALSRLKKAWWELRSEARICLLWYVSRVPGEVGSLMRSWCFRRYLKGLGHNNVFQAGTRITSPEHVTIGSHCNFAQGVFITGGGGVHIGDWVGLGPDVKVWSVNHRFEDPDTPWQLQGWDMKPVTIEDDVWIGANAFVMPGVSIGKGAIISACSVVNKSIPPFAIVAGNPARVVGWRKPPADAIEDVQPVASRA